MAGGIVGPSDRGIITSVLHRRDTRPSWLPPNYVSSHSVCIRVAFAVSTFLTAYVSLRKSRAATVKPGQTGSGGGAPRRCVFWQGVSHLTSFSSLVRVAHAQ